MRRPALLTTLRHSTLRPLSPSAHTQQNLTHARTHKQCTSAACISADSKVYEFAEYVDIAKKKNALAKAFSASGPKSKPLTTYKKLKSVNMARFFYQT